MSYAIIYFFKSNGSLIFVSSDATYNLGIKSDTTLTFIVLVFSIPYFVYLALGYQDTSIFKFITTQAVLNITVSSLPFPGAVGISEAIFMKLYKNLFNPNVLGSAMFITRFINFYLFVIISGIVVMINHIKWKDKDKNN